MANVTPPDDESRLLQALLDRQRSAWVEFVRRYDGIVAAAVRRAALQCGVELRRADLEDLCAEVFAGLLHDDMSALRRFESRCRLSTWLTIIARRTCFKRLRAVCGREGFLPHDPLPDALLPQSIDLLERMVADEDRRSLERAMRRLREGDRAILELFFREELSYRQIGERLGISTNAVGPKLFRAQQRLKRAMQWA